jgi:cytochrome c oxidase subunit 1
MMYALGFIMLFTLGGLTGLFLGALAVDVHVHDTYFVVAHFHYVMVGSVLFAFLGGMYHWWPKITGRMFDDRLGRLAAILLFIGFNVTFFPQFVAGSHGMPRRYASYPIEYQAYHVISSIGAYLMAIALFMVLANWIQSLRSGRRAPANPWGANTLEWHAPSPPPHDNFKVQPEVSDPYQLENWKYDPSVQGWVLHESPRPRRVHAH